MPKLNNMYYSQYASSTESEAGYDSDNKDTYKRLIESPSQTNFRQYIERRRDEELLHESWKVRLRDHLIDTEDIKEKCGMAVDLGDDRVCYVYKPAINDPIIPGIKFKITFLYIRLLRKWYISLGYSRLPDIVDLHNKMQKGTYNPIGLRVLELVHKVKNILDIYVQKLIYIYKMIDIMKVYKSYKDMEFEVKPCLTSVKVMLKEKAWPKSLRKTCPEDIIILEIVLDENFKTDDLAYEYIYNKNLSAQQKKICIAKLDKKLEIFFDYDLIEALQMFIEEDSNGENQS